jgi:glycerophosphoryl diester phosphodiesterase
MPKKRISKQSNALKKYILRPFIVLVLVVVLIYAASFVAMLWPDTQKPFYKAVTLRRQPAVFSHQGGEGIRPTNTAVAFKDTWAMGVDVLDADMHMTSDGVLVLAHDETIDRVSNGTGALRDTTLEALRSYDFGYDFTTDNGATFPYRGKGLSIMTLEELYAGYPDALFGIEIKQTTVEAAEKLCEITKKFGYEDKLLVSAFAQQNMDRFREVCPRVATSGTQDETKRFFIFHRLGLAGLYRASFDSLQVPEYSGDTHVLTPRFIWDSQKKGYAVIPWTINEDADLRRVGALGVDGINTNYPDRMVNIFKEKD